MFFLQEMEDSFTFLLNDDSFKSKDLVFSRPFLNPNTARSFKRKGVKQNFQLKKISCSIQLGRMLV